jgi:2-alkenal reductase
LLDSAGRLIGVNTAIISGSGTSAGIGFAVPVDVVNEVVPQLISKGKVSRPGIGIAALDDETAAALGVLGVVIERVASGSEADRAGLQGIDYRRRILGDIIVAVDGKPVKRVDEFIRILQTYDIGQTVILSVKQGDRIRDVSVGIMDIS